MNDKQIKIINRTLLLVQIATVSLSALVAVAAVAFTVSASNSISTLYTTCQMTACNSQLLQDTATRFGEISNNIEAYSVCLTLLLLGLLATSIALKKWHVTLVDISLAIMAALFFFVATNTESLYVNLFL